MSVGARRNEISRLKREIAYYCGVVARANSRERIRHAHALISLRERQLRDAHSAATRREATGE